MSRLLPRRVFGWLASGLLASGLAALVPAVSADDPPPAKPADPPKDKPPADPSKPADPAKPADGDKPKEEKAPDFKLKDLDGKERTLAEFKDKWVVLEWTSYGCPYVKKHYGSGHMQALQKTYVDKGVVWLSICSSAPGKEGNMSVADWKKAAEERKVAATAILLDEDGTVGHLYDAKTTPDMRVISPQGTIVYSGAIDDWSPTNKVKPEEAKNYVAEVLDAVLAGKPAPIAATKSYG